MSSGGVGDRIIKFLGLKSTSNPSVASVCGGAHCQQQDHQNGCPLQHSSGSGGHDMRHIHEEQIEYQLTNEQKFGLCRKANIADRMKTIRDLEEEVRYKRLVDYAVKCIINETMDLLDDNQPPDVRHTVWKFYKHLVAGQYDKLKELRPLLWDLVANKDKGDEDIPLRMDVLIAMTNNGKNHESFETKIGRFVIQCFDKMTANPKTSAEFLTFIVNLIKFNSVYLDQKIMADIINRICHLMARVTTNEETSIAIYHIMDAILVKSMLPTICLTQFVIVLCKGVNNTSFNALCVDIMRNILSSHLGHSCIETLRYILNDETNYEDTSLMRGAVHFVTRSLWDPIRIENLKHSPNSILPAFKSALQCKHQSVALEMSVALIALVDSQKHIESEVTWDLMLEIMDNIVSNYEITGQQSGHELSQTFHRLLDVVEELNEKKQFFGDSNKLFDILEKCSPHRSVSEQSGKRVIQYRVQSITADKDNWIESLKHLMDIYYKGEKRTFIRIEALNILSEFMRQYRYIHEEILLETIIIPYLNHIENDLDVECRVRGVQFLVDLVSDSNSAKRCAEILEILDRVCKRLFDSSHAIAGNTTGSPSDAEGKDIKIAIRGLISLFKTKLFSFPGSAAIQTFKIILSQLSAHYSNADYNSNLGQIGSIVKQEIFDLLLNIRANSKGQIGVYQRINPSKSDNTPKYSLFIVCERNELSPNASTAASPVVSATTQTSNPLSPPPSPILHSVNTNANNLWTLSFNDMFRVLAICLKTEKDWTVLSLVLKALPKFLKNKAIILSGSAHIATDLCTALCYLISDTSTKLNEFQSKGQNLSKAEFQSTVYPCLSALVGYQSELEFRQQCSIIKYLQNGLVLVSGRTSVLRQNILSLTICAVEMQEAMTKCLPDTLLSLSKISATVPLSIPKLEFLSNVILLSHLYQSFTMDQYMSVFAIALPYTNPFKFNDYTVALAHRVIAMWFLKCRLPCRKSIVPFIIKGLQTNVMSDEMNPHPNQYIDAQRLRSSSLNTDQSLAHKKLEARLSLQSSPPPLPSTPHSSHSHFSFSFSSDAIAQHNQHSPQPLTTTTSICENEFQELRHELVETCMDMLASYTFGMCSTVPLKSPMVEPLLDRSKSETWIMGHKLVTITTSGCGSRAVSNGLCDKCLNMCRNSDNSDNSSNEDIQRNSNDVFQKLSELKNNRSESVNTTDSDKLVRRRHQSDMGLVRRPQSSKPKSSAFDDSCLTRPIQRTNSLPKNATTLCNCWCQGWAEITIRRSTGVSSWIVRLQNSLGNIPYSSSPPDDLPDLTALLRPNNRTREPSVEDSIGAIECDSNRNSFDVNEIENDSVFKRVTSSPYMMTDSNNTSPAIHSLNNSSPLTLSQPNGAEKSLTFRPIEPSPPTHASRASPLQPVTRAQSFGSKGRVDYRQRLIERHDFRSNDLESNDLQRHSREHTEHKSRTPVPIRINEAENMSGPRDRVHTISVMSPVNANINRRLNKDHDSSYSMPKSSGLCPKFVFLQLYYNSMFDDKCHEMRVNKDMDLYEKTKPILLPKNEAIDRSLKNLDRITPYETHKIGVLYVGAGQAKDKTAILSNPFGSLRYIKFLRGLGKMIRLEDADSQVSYVGGLDVKGGHDGKYAVAWEDSLIQVIFHVATLMPTKSDTDPNCNNKKRHIGNDAVCVVYNESGSSVNISTIKGDGQCIQAIVVITPFEYNSNLVTIQAKDDFLNLIQHFDSQMLSDNALPVFVRQLALHANLGSMVYNGTPSATTTQHVSNWVQRLKQIKRIRQRVTNKSATDTSVRLHTDSNDDSNSGLNPQTGDIKWQYMFPDFNDYS
ncbi:unnamed protein product [Medioppia subpectinata]|uniref:Rap-GAP domain-containing protein n=1 Tax=Medioppia subpectinata TaxID=1979941 RepID=A0A7R9PVB5_9ACAR|nr:unnamed protein product [Medioppia subpectinata]CAG2101678.1 unnamed protein product [Medioppia subpectinata]